MFEAMRRKERQITGEETEEILKNGEYGIFSSVGEDGYPYGVPVNYIFYNGRIYFHCAAQVGKKLDNLKFSDKACFTVVAQAEVFPQELSTRYQGRNLASPVRPLCPGVSRGDGKIPQKSDGGYRYRGAGPGTHDGQEKKIGKDPLTAAQFDRGLPPAASTGETHVPGDPRQ